MPGQERRAARADRERSWIEFDRRVLELARDGNTPLWERLRFLDIFTSNLDEFCMIRVGSLCDRALSYKEGSGERAALEERLRAIRRDMAGLYAERDEVFGLCARELRAGGLERVRPEDLPKDGKTRLRALFDRELRPLLSPQVVDARHPFPHMENRRLFIAAGFKGSGKAGLAPVPDSLPRVLLPAGGGWMLLEDALLYWAGRVFGQDGINGRILLRVTRNAGLDFAEIFEDERGDYKKKMERLTRRRTLLAPVRLEAGPGDPGVAEFVRERLGLPPEGAALSRSPLDYGFLPALERLIPDGLRNGWFFAPHRQIWPAGLSPDGPLWPQAARRDILIRTPYESAAPIPRLLGEAADDPSVTGVRITLYRVGDYSEIVAQLCRCAENGKDVTAFVELGARFDEERNLGWASRLEESGCRVFFGRDGCKVHAKIMLLTRRTERGAEYLCHFGTGNYNEKNSRQYADYGLITTRTGLCRDAAAFFDRLSLGLPAGFYKKLVASPDGMRAFLKSAIDGEIISAREGRGGRVLAKMNGLADEEICEKLAEASRAGVSVRLIVRGACCLLPGVPGETENVEIISVLGRFLEHGRLFAFGTGRQTKLWLSSADWMTRNLDRRTELAVPVLDGAVKNALIREMEGAFRARRWVLGSDGKYCPGL